MTKRNAARKTKQPTWLLAGIAVIAIVVIAFLALQATTAPQQTAATGGLISPQDYQTQFVEAGKAHLLLDVRTPEEFTSGYIAGAANISLQTLAGRLNEVPTDEPVVVYCRSGNRSAQAAQLLKEAGYTQVYDLGGVNGWTAAGFTLQQ